MSDPTRTPLRVLFLIDNLRPGGCQKAAIAICRSLVSRGDSVTVWRLGGTSPEIESGFSSAGAVMRGGSRSGLGALMRLPGLVRHLRRERVDIVQTFLFHSDIAGRVAGRLARIGRKRPLIISSIRASNHGNRWWQFALARLTAPLADAFTSVCRASLDFAARKEGVRADQTTVIPNGIDLSEWRMPDRDAARAALQIPPGAFVIGTIGRLHEQKGHRYLLDAAAAVLRRRPDALFLIAGYGPLQATLEAQASELGIASSVRFLGYRPDPAAILAALDLFVLPSLWEGMSNALLEAMAAGQTIVATSVDAAPEQIVHGESGMLVAPANADELAEAITFLSFDPAKAAALGRNARERVESVFPMRRMTQAYLDLYDSMMQDRS